MIRQLTENSFVEHGMIPLDLHIRDLDVFDAFWHSNTKVLNNFRYCQVYGRSLFDSLPISPFLQRYVDWVSDKEGIEYNSVVVNWYDGDYNHYIGWHRYSDESNVYTISFGSGRMFMIRSNNNCIDSYMHSTHNSYIVMGGNFQKEFTHNIQNTKKEKEKRISITIRRFKF